MLDHSHTLRDRAYVLRMDHDLSLRAIAKRLDVPLGTVGMWLKGQGETRHVLACKLCGADFFAQRSHAALCSVACKAKWKRCFGV